MGKLIDKIRSWFCKHEWECLAEEVEVYDTDMYGRIRDIPAYYKWVYVCKKCKTKKEVKV